MSTIMIIADLHNLYVIKDVAQGIMSFYKDRPLGSIGNLGCLSFHDTKNCTAAGKKYGIFRGKDLYATKESERLARLLLWFNINEVEITSVIENTKKCVLGVGIE